MTVKTIWLYAHDSSMVEEALEGVMEDIPWGLETEDDVKVITEIVQERPMYEVGVEFSLESKKPVSVKINGGHYRLERL